MSYAGIERLLQASAEPPPVLGPGENLGILQGRLGRRRVWRSYPDTAAAWAAPWWALTWLLTGGRLGRLPWTWEAVTPARAQEDAAAERRRLHGCDCGRICRGSTAARGRRITAWQVCPEILCQHRVWKNGPGELPLAPRGGTGEQVSALLDFERGQR